MTELATTRHLPADPRGGKALNFKIVCGTVVADSSDAVNVLGRPRKIRRVGRLETLQPGKMHGPWAIQVLGYRS